MGYQLGRMAIAAQLPEHEAIKQVLRSAERLRAVGVALHHANRWWKTGIDSWAKETENDKRRVQHLSNRSDNHKSGG